MPGNRAADEARAANDDEFPTLRRHFDIHFVLILHIGTQCV
jgi:hypothetical protein